MEIRDTFSNFLKNYLYFFIFIFLHADVYTLHCGISKRLYIESGTSWGQGYNFIELPLVKYTSGGGGGGR